MHVSLNVALSVGVLMSQQGSAASVPVLERLAGQWTGSGVVNNGQVSAKADFDAVLAKRFMRLRYVFTVDGVGEVFEGHAYYACAKDADTCRGNWFDSQGAAHILTAVHTQNVLTSEWGDGTTPRGRTEYRLTSATTLVVTDWVRTAAGEWRQFGKVEYLRSSSGAAPRGCPLFVDDGADAAHEHPHHVEGQEAEGVTSDSTPTVAKTMADLSSNGSVSVPYSLRPPLS